MLKDLLRYRAKPVRIGFVLIVLALIGLVVAYEINTSFSLFFWDKGYEVKADFTDADGIANASDIRIAGTYVGQITQVRSVQGGLAEITMRIDSRHSPLPEGTTANLRLQTLLGTKFIELTPGPSSNRAMAAGTVIPSNSTQSPVDFDQFLSSFDKPTRDSTSKIIQELGTATDGRGQNINSLLGNLHGMSVNSNSDLTTFGDRQQNLDHILVGLDDVAGNLSDNRQHLANLYTNLDAILGTIATNDTGFRRFIEQGNVGLGHGINQFNGESQNINDVFRLLNPTLNKLNPVLVDVNNITIADEPFIQIVKQFSSDIASANSAYNANTNNGKQGGWFLRQPVILSEASNPNNNCEQKAPPATCSSSVFNPGGGAAQANAQPSSAAPVKPGPRVAPKQPLPLPLPVPLPSVPGILPGPGGASPAIIGVPGLTQPGALPGPGGPILGVGAVGSSAYFDTYAESPEMALFTFLLGSGG